MERLSVPGFLDAAGFILWEQRRTGTRLYSGALTRCQEMSQRISFRSGGFAPDGLSVGIGATVNVNIGVAGLRKF